MKRSKLAVARGAMHDARNCENQIRENYRQLKQEMAAMKRRQNAMVQALARCAETFREYEAIHAAKPDMAKARRNAKMAEMAEAAIGKAEQA